MIEIADENYLDTPETASRLGVTPGHLRNLRTDRRSPVPFRKVGASVFYRESDVAAYLLRGDA
jgi:hypothetical protein